MITAPVACQHRSGRDMRRWIVGCPAHGMVTQLQPNVFSPADSSSAELHWYRPALPCYSRLLRTQSSAQIYWISFGKLLASYSPCACSNFSAHDWNIIYCRSFGWDVVLSRRARNAFLWPHLPNALRSHAAPVYVCLRACMCVCLFYLHLHRCCLFSSCAEALRPNKCFIIFCMHAWTMPHSKVVLESI